MAEQTIALPASSFFNGINGAGWTLSPEIEIDAVLRNDPTAPLTFRTIRVSYIRPPLFLREIDVEVTGGDLSAAFEATGSVTLTTADGDTVAVSIAGADMTAPYSWVPTNGAEVSAFMSSVGSYLEGTLAATLVISDGASAVPTFGPLTEFSSLADFEAAFTADLQTGTSGGRWRFDPGGSTQTSSTGPGTNNGLDFVHTETSGSSLAGAEAAGLAEFATVPTGTGRMLHMRLCIQGAFGDGTEGLEIQQRASADDAWAMVTLITGWLYSDSRAAGDTVTDFAGEDQTVVASGGWVDFTVAIPDAATQVRLQPRYIQGEGSTWEHDIALRSFQWEYGGGDAGLSAPSWADNTGDPVTWVTGEAIATITVPEASGSPAPTYAVVGSLPGGIVFDSSTRDISGTPTAAGSGTIVIRATNSEGNADWSVAYQVTQAPPPGLSTPPILVGDSAAVTTPALQVRFLVTTPRVLIDAGLVENDGVAYFGNLQLYLDRDLPMGLRIAPDLTTGFGGASPNLTPAWEESIRALIITAGGHTLEIPGPTHSTNQNSDSGDEPYDWLPSVAKVAEIQAWITTFRALSDDEREATTLTLNDGAVVAPGEVALQAAGSLTGGLTGSIEGAAALSAPPLASPLQAAGSLTGGLTGSIEGAAELIEAPRPAPESISFTPIKSANIQIEAFQISLTNSSRQTIILTPTTAELSVLAVWWAEQVGQWFFDLETQDGEPIANSKAIVPRTLLARAFDERFKGDFYVRGPLRGVIGRTSWADNIYKMYYLPPDTVLDLRSRFPWL